MNYRLTLFLIVATLCLPDIRLSSSFAVRPEDLIILAAFLLLLYQRCWYDDLFIRLLLVLGVIMFISIGWNERLLSLNSFEFYNKVIKGIVSYTLCMQGMQDSADRQRISTCLLLIFVFMIIVNFMQLLKLPGLNSFWALYSNQGQIDAFERRSEYSLPRLTGILGNPNTNATFFLMLLGASLDLWLLRGKKFLPLLAAGLIVLLLTQSRTMFLSALLLLLIALYFSRKFGLILLGVGVYFILNLLDIQYLGLIFDANQMAQTHSVTGRIDQWEILLAMIKLHPLLGYGGYKEYFYITKAYPENEYILGWFRYGIGYLIGYIILFTLFLIKGFGQIIRKENGGYLLVATNLAMLIGSISNTPFNNPRLFVTYIIFSAYAINRERSHGVYGQE